MSHDTSLSPMRRVIDESFFFRLVLKAPTSSEYLPYVSCQEPRVHPNPASKDWLLIQKMEFDKAVRAGHL